MIYCNLMLYLRPVNREGRNEVGGRGPVSRRSMQSYILTYSRLIKGEPLNALRFYKGERGGGEFLRPWYPIMEDEEEEEEEEEEG